MPRIGYFIRIWRVHGTLYNTCNGDNVPTIVYTHTNTLFLLIKRFNFFFYQSPYYCFSKKRLYHVICHVIVLF